MKIEIEIPDNDYCCDDNNEIYCLLHDGEDNICKLYKKDLITEDTEDFNIVTHKCDECKKNNKCHIS